MTKHNCRDLFNINFGIEPERAQQWLHDLLELVSIAEQRPEPQINDEETSAERVAQSIRSRSSYLIPALTLGAIMVFYICTVAISVVIVLLASGQ